MRHKNEINKEEEITIYVKFIGNIIIYKALTTPSKEHLFSVKSGDGNKK